MPKKIDDKLNLLALILIVLGLISSNNTPTPSIWSKFLMGIGILLGVYILGKKIYLYIKSGKPIGEAFIPKKSPNGSLLISILFVIWGINLLIYKPLPTWLFIAIIFSALYFAFNAGKILYEKFKKRN